MFPCSNTLAKSLPATLPSRSYCSKKFKERGVEKSTISRELNRSWESAATPRSTSRNIESRNSSCSSQSPNLSRLNHSKQINEESKSGVVGLSVIILVTILAVVVYQRVSTRAINHVYDELRYHRDLNDLGAKYEVGVNSILKIQTGAVLIFYQQRSYLFFLQLLCTYVCIFSTYNFFKTIPGISTIYKREDTTCLIFVYNSMSKNFDQIKFDGFVNNIASKTAKFLRK